MLERRRVMRKFLFSALAAVLLAVPATATNAQASWLSQWLHTRFDPTYNSGYYYYPDPYAYQPAPYYYTSNYYPVPAPVYTYTPTYYDTYVSPYYVPYATYSRPGWYRPYYRGHESWYGGHWTGWRGGHEVHEHHHR
jgi:hypothetical protein